MALSKDAEVSMKREFWRRWRASLASKFGCLRVPTLCRME